MGQHSLIIGFWTDTAVVKTVLRNGDIAVV
jgi:hypothetical protein